MTEPRHYAHIIYDHDWVDELESRTPIALTRGGEAPSNTTILINGRPSKDEIERLPNLASIIIPFAGVPETTQDLLRDFPQIRLYNLHHNAADTAEMALTLLFAAARLLPNIHDSMKCGNWSPRFDDSRALRLAGRNALVLGAGAIGGRIKDVLGAVGMNVRVIRRKASSESYTLADLDDLLPSSHVLVVALPMTPETKGVLTRNRIHLLPEKAILVNVGRGPLIDEGGLYEALKSGHLHSAGLDVWWTYPQQPSENSQFSSSEFPFHELENVVMSPHVGGATDQSENHRVSDLVQLIQLIICGDHSLAIDPSRGY